MKDSSAYSFILCCLLLIPAEVRSQEEDHYAERHVAILSAYQSFDAARADAERISQASEVPFSMLGRGYDEKRGLVYPDDFEVEGFRGQYIPRRYDTTVLKDGDGKSAYLSVEKSDAYEGFAPGFYIVVAGINDTRDQALEQAGKFKAWAATAYVKKTRIYMGCLH